MKAVTVAGGSPDTPESEGTELPTTGLGTGDTTAGSGGPDEAEASTADDAAEAAASEAVAAEPAGQRETEAAPESPASEAAAEADADVDPGEADADPVADPEGTTTAGEPGDDPAEQPLPGAPESADAPNAPDAEAVSDDEPGTGGEAAADAQPEPEPEQQATAHEKPEEEAGQPTETADEADPDAQPEPDQETAADNEAEDEAENGDEAAPEAQSGTDPATGDGDGDGETESEAGQTAEADPDAQPEAETGQTAENSAEADPDAQPEAETGQPAESDDDDADEAAAEAATGDEAEPEDGQEAVADEAGPGARKVPSWARGGDSDAERTSTFVALKELGAPAPAPTDEPATPPAQARAKAPAVPPAKWPALQQPQHSQQPRPHVVEPKRAAPLPPLELLAELTNTAPPPETPRRTALRRVKIWTPILLLLAGAVTGAQLLRPLPAAQLVAAEQAHTLDGQFSVPWPAKGQGAVRVAGSGDIGTFGEQKPVPTASVAKVMTAYVVLKGHPLRKGEAGPQITVDAKTVADGTSENESRIEGLSAGTKFSQQDMLKMLMIPSGNNVARLLARWDTGTDSEAAFVEKMNAAARELGMTDTTYTDPSGLDAGTVSTATDQLKLAEAVMKDEAFRAIVALPSAEIKGLPKPISNNNDLLTVNGLSVRGIKTGSSTPAGGALMWAAYKSVGDETPLILGTLMEQRADGPDHNAENSLILVKANSRKIIEAVRGALASAPVVRKGQTVGYVDDGLGGRTPLVATRDLNVIGVPGQQLKLTLRAGASPVPHTAKAGSELGVLTVGEGEGAKSVPVAVRGALSEPSFGTRITRLR
ncbi:serine hydrolase [Streptomyces xanthophaeus]|uniref:serine hydrolase n=1 Tax=Streptomyces xanthophaeus TaxID=67385 RepID=UPI00398FC5F0